MTTKVIMPQMGESIFEGTITKWLKKVGDTIARDEPLFEISTDKVDSEIPSPAAGTISEILVPEGQTVQINTVVAVIEESDKTAVQAEPKVAESKAAEPAAAEAPPAEPKEETPAAAEPAAAEAARAEPKVETAAAAEPPTDEAPPAETESRAGEEPAPVETEPEPEKPKTEPVMRPVAAPPAKSSAPVSPPAREIRASPLVRRLARENEVDLTRIHGTGLGGRITKQDISSYIDQEIEAPAPPPPAEYAPVEPAAAAQVAPARPKVVAPETPKPSEAPKSPEAPKTIGEAESVPMTPMRKAIAEHMVLSRKTSAHVSTLFEVDMTSIVRLREKHKESFEAKEGIKLTYTPFFVKALVEAVGEFPVLNCSISGDNIVYHRAVNVGIAVALETGLIVPVVRDAQLKSFTGLALAITQLAENARTKKLKPDDVKNGTITVTNPGVYGALFGTPIINQPQVAILGIGGIERRPVVVNDAIAIRSMVYLSLSFDHRMIDGAVADQFMASLKHRLQAWTQWTS